MQVLCFFGLSDWARVSLITAQVPFLLQYIKVTKLLETLLSQS
jgi:hypothetical protein